MFQSGCVIAGQRDSISSFVKRALKRIASTPKSKKVRVSFGRASGQSSSREKEEVNYEVAQVMDELESQRRDRQMAMNLVEKTNGSMQIHGMSENELIEYAKVLSVQDSHSAVCDTDQSQIDLALTLSISLKQDQ